MIKAIWECSKCHYTKTTKYHEEEFNDKLYLADFIKYSKHSCPKCKEQCLMTIKEIVGVK